MRVTHPGVQLGSPHSIAFHTSPALPGDRYSRRDVGLIRTEVVLLLAGVPNWWNVGATVV